MYLARKISRAKWDKELNLERGLKKEEISAGAVTGDLRTGGPLGNCLSLWRCGSGSKSEIEEAVLAIAASADKVDKFDIVLLCSDRLENDGHTLEDTKGRTPVADLVDSHVDICKLDYYRLGLIANCVLDAVNDGQHQRFTKNEVQNLLINAVNLQRINLDELAVDIRTFITP